jgi:hypothetical protein
MNTACYVMAAATKIESTKYDPAVIVLDEREMAAHDAALVA